MTTSPITDWITRLTAVQGEARLTLLHELRERPEEYDAVVLRLLVRDDPPNNRRLFAVFCVGVGTGVLLALWMVLPGL